MKLTTWKVDVTPPIGHPLCAGWHSPAVGIDDALFATGIIFVDADEAPVVLCSIDWCEISNRSYFAWCEKLAGAAGTTPDRVSVHCIHPHCTPWPDERAQQLIEVQTGIRDVMDMAWCAIALESVADGARAAMNDLKTVTHLQTGRAKVDRVASNRRIMGEDGTVKAVRWTATVDAAVRAEPEGLIDPWLKTLSFWNQQTKLAALHYYAVHPSSYEDLRITREFTGLARERRQSQDNDVPHLYFTECAGNITAGKYNDGATENREIFTQRILRAMTDSETQMQRVPIPGFEWRTTNIQLPPRDDISDSGLRDVVRDTSLNTKVRSQAALQLAYRERLETPIQISALHFGQSVSLLHLPGEAFIEYQLFAQSQLPDSFVVAPAYGDCGPGYICLENSLEEGGYEPKDSFVAGRSEDVLKNAIVRVMKG